MTNTTARDDDHVEQRRQRGGHDHDADDHGGHDDERRIDHELEREEVLDSIKNCAQLQSLGKKFAAAVQASTGKARHGRRRSRRRIELFKALADASPSAIHGDFETLANAFAASATALQKANLTAGARRPLPPSSQSSKRRARRSARPRSQAAEQHLEAWGTTHCAGVTTTS